MLSMKEMPNIEVIRSHLAAGGAPVMPAAASGVYMLVNRTNGGAYIGASSNMAFRAGRQLELLRRNKHPVQQLQADWLEHGEAAFTVAAVCACAPEEVAVIERQCILQLESRWRYNVNEGGAGHRGAGNRLGREATKKPVAISLDDDQRELLRTLGGSKWVQQQLAKAAKRQLRSN